MNRRKVFKCDIYAKYRDDEKLKIIDHDLLRLSPDYYDLSFSPHRKNLNPCMTMIATIHDSEARNFCHHPFLNLYSP